MKSLYTIHLLIALSTALPIAVVEDKSVPSPIKLPKVVISPEPKPVPPQAIGTPTLTPDTLYVIESKVECAIRSYPKGLVKITKVGPGTIRAKFIDGTGVNEFRTFAGPYVYLLEAEITANGRVELEVIPYGFKTEAEIVSASIDVKGNQAPKPPPTPDPKPEPREDFTWVIVVEETSARDQDTLKVLGDVELWKRLKNSGKNWRFYDIDSPDTKEKKYDAVVKGVGLPCVILLNAKGDVVDKFKLPKTAKELEAKLK